jgi:uncharacterized protein
MSDTSIPKRKSTINAQLWVNAAGVGDIATVKALAKAGADINARTDAGETALMRASSNGHIETVKLLIEEGAELDVIREDGFTALMCAAFFGQKRVVTALVEGGADPNVKDRLGSTAATWAERRGFLEIHEFLHRYAPAPVTVPEIKEPVSAPETSAEEIKEVNVIEEPLPVPVVETATIDEVAPVELVEPVALVQVPEPEPKTEEPIPVEVRQEIPAEALPPVEPLPVEITPAAFEAPVIDTPVVKVRPIRKRVEKARQRKKEPQKKAAPEPLIEAPAPLIEAPTLAEVIALEVPRSAPETEQVPVEVTPEVQPKTIVPPVKSRSYRTYYRYGAIGMAAALAIAFVSVTLHFGLREIERESFRPQQVAQLNEVPKPLEEVSSEVEEKQRVEEPAPATAEIIESLTTRSHEPRSRPTPRLREGRRENSQKLAKIVTIVEEMKRTVPSVVKERPVVNNMTVAIQKVSTQRSDSLISNLPAQPVTKKKVLLWP